MYQRKKKIPTVLALLILFAGIGGVVFLDSNSHYTVTRANPAIQPEKVHVTNVSESSFSVSWVSGESVIGMVEVSGNDKKILIPDDLDNDNSYRPRTSHYVTVKNLSENTSYSIRVFNGKTCDLQNNCMLLTQQTLAKQPNPNSLPPVKGSVISPDGGNSGIIVYVAIGKALPRSGRTDSSGLYVIPLNLLSSEPYGEKLEFSDVDMIQITADKSPLETVSAVTDIKSVRQYMTLPPIQIGNSYNFIDLSKKKSNLAQTPGNQTVLGAQVAEFGKQTIDIIFPLANDDLTTETRPRFRGTGPKDREILITVNSQPQTGKATVKKDGTWEWRPQNDLPPGRHTITIGYNEGNKLVTVSKSFIILKSGERVLGDATSSATISPTTKVSPTKMPSPTEVIATPTFVPSSTPLYSPTPRITSGPAITTPPTGNMKPTLLLIIGGISLLALGARLIFVP